MHDYPECPVPDTECSPPSKFQALSRIINRIHPCGRVAIASIPRTTTDPRTTTEWHLTRQPGVQGLHVVDIAEMMKEKRARQTVRFPTGNGFLVLHEKDGVFLVDWLVHGSGVPSFHYYNLATFSLA